MRNFFRGLVRDGNDGDDGELDYCLLPPNTEMNECKKWSSSSIKSDMGLNP